MTGKRRRFSAFPAFVLLVSLLPFGASALAATPPKISIGNKTVVEGDTADSASFKVSLSKTSSKTVKVNYTTIAQTATAGEDFVAKSGTLKFLAGQKSNSILIVLNGDTVDEADETFQVKLSSPVATKIDDGTGKGTIRDDDGPTISVSDASIEEGENGVALVTLDDPSPQQITVDWSTSPGTATGPADYPQNFGTVIFPPNSDTQGIAVLTTDDSTYEYSGDVFESFHIDLSDPVNAGIGDGQNNVTLVDNDAPPCSPPTELDDTSGNATALGNISGDTLPAAVSTAGVLRCLNDQDWYKFVLTEDNGSTEDLTVTISMDPNEGAAREGQTTHLRVCIYVSNPTSPSFTACEQSLEDPVEIQGSIPDLAPFDQDTNIWVKVEPEEVSSWGGYSLLITGETV